MKPLTHALLVGFLSAAMAFPPPVLLAQEPSQVVGLEYVPEEAIGLVQVQTGPLLNSPAASAYPVEVVEAFGKKYLGLNPMKITGMTFLIARPIEVLFVPEFAAFVKTSETLNEETFFANISELGDDVFINEKTDESFPELRGKSFRFEGSPTDSWCAHMLDEHTFLIGSEAFVVDLVQKGPHQTLTQAAQILAENSEDSDASAVFNMAPVRGSINKALAEQPVPPPFGMFKQIPNYTESITLQLSAKDGFQTTLKINGVDEPSAKRLEQMLKLAIDMGKQIMLMQAHQMLASEDEVEVAMGKYQERFANNLFTQMTPTREGKSLVLTYKQDESLLGGGNVAVMGILVALLLPAVQQARYAARRMQSLNNMKQIGLAFHNYHFTNNGFPAQASTDEDGKRLLSWRVHLLPYLEQQELYDQFHLDEPWDSEHNRRLIELMPEVYRDPRSTAPEGYTTYIVPVGKGLAFEEPSKERREGLGFKYMVDGTSLTAMMVDANDDAAVIWTKPDDLEVDLENPWNHIDDTGPEGVQVLLVDGSVETLSPEKTAKYLQLLFQRNDGEELPPN